jgi:hypothetical protein
MLKLKPAPKRPDQSWAKNGKIDMQVWKIGNIGYIVDSQRLKWQQNRQQTSNKPVTLTIKPASEEN